MECAPQEREWEQGQRLATWVCGSAFPGGCIVIDRHSGSRSLGCESQCRTELMALFGSLR